MEMSGQLHAPAVLLQEERAPGIQCMHDWVGQGAGLDAVGNRT
jgi:hypothetical protein